MDKIILVHYIGIGNLNMCECDEHLTKIKNMLNNDENIIHYIIPMRGEENTRIECLNPKLVSEEDYQQAKDMLNRNQEIVNNIINNK